MTLVYQFRSVLQCTTCNNDFFYTVDDNIGSDAIIFRWMMMMVIVVKITTISLTRVGVCVCVLVCACA